MLNLLVNLWFLVTSIISIGYKLTWIMLYHILSWCCHYLGLFLYFKRKGGHEWIRIVHQDNSNHFIFTFRDDYSEYEDHMDISKCIPSMRGSDMSSRHPSEKQIISTSSKFSPEGHPWLPFPEDKDKYLAEDWKAGQSQWMDKYTQWLG